MGSLEFDILQLGMRLEALEQHCPDCAACEGFSAMGYWSGMAYRMAERVTALEARVAAMEPSPWWLGEQAALIARVAEWGALVEEHEAYFAPLKARVLEAARPAPPAADTCERCVTCALGSADCEPEWVDGRCLTYKPAPQAAAAVKRDHGCWDCIGCDEPICDEWQPRQGGRP